MRESWLVGNTLSKVCLSNLITHSLKCLLRYFWSHTRHPSMYSRRLLSVIKYPNLGPYSLPLFVKVFVRFHYYSSGKVVNKNAPSTGDKNKQYTTYYLSYKIKLDSRFSTLPTPMKALQIIFSPQCQFSTEVCPCDGGNNNFGISRFN